MTFAMSRRSALGALAAAATTTLPTFASAQTRIELIYSDTVAEADPRAAVLRDVFGKNLGPEFDFKPYFGATLYKQGTEPVAMQRGNLHLANLAAFDVQKQIPAWSIVTTPYIFRDHVHMKKVFASDVGKELFAMMEKQMGIKVLSVPYIGIRHLGLRTKKKIMTPADLAGVKLRMPPGEGWQFVGTAMGANPTPLPFPEVYTALQTGAIDAQDNALPAVKSMKFYEVSKQISLTGHLVAANHFVISSKKWAAMSADQQRRVQAAASKAEEDITNMALKDEAELVAFFKKEGLDVYTPDLSAFRSQVLAQYAKSKFAAGWVPGMMERINKL